MRRSILFRFFDGREQIRYLYPGPTTRGFLPDCHIPHYASRNGHRRPVNSDDFWMAGGSLPGCCPARAVTIQIAAKSCALEGSPKAASASRNKGSATTYRAGFSRMSFPSGPTFRNTQVIAWRSPLDTFSSCDWMVISRNPAASRMRRTCSGYVRRRIFDPRHSVTQRSD